MKFRYLLSLLLTITSINILPQENKSAHQNDYENLGTRIKQPGEFDPSGKGIIPLKKEKANTNWVFGYLPDWEYSADRQYLKYDLLTHIAAFDFTVSSTGAITNPSYWPWTDVINAAHSAGVKVILCAVCFDTAAISALLTNATVKQAFFTNLKSKITQYQLDGVNIDFEGMKTSLRGSIMNTFMQDLTTYMHAQITGSEVSFAGPAVNWSGWNLAGLAAACDYIFIMGYDFYGSWSTTTGASAPLVGGSYNITNTVNTQYAGINPQKLILGCPYYGQKWMTKTNLPHAQVTKFIGATFARNDIPNSGTYGKKWAADNLVPWYTWQNNDTSWYQVWFDNDSSLTLKYNLAKSKNFKGVGMWALGYDGNLSVLWDLIRRSIIVPVELSNFSVSQIKDNIIVEWTTSTEKNNHGFELYRTDLTNNQKILCGFKEGAGNSTVPSHYFFSDPVNKKGNYSYSLIQVDFNGERNEVASKEIYADMHMKYFLGQNYPNPFNPETKINFMLPEKSNISLIIYDVMGREIKTLAEGLYEAGSYTLKWDGTNNFKQKAASGLYFYKLNSAGFSAICKMALVK